MKKTFKKSNIFSFLLGAIIFGGIVGVSAYTIFATDIGYTPSDSTWKKTNGENITNVKDAIDELYNKANNNDSFSNKTYIQDGLTIYDNRAEILNGGYYIDDSNIVWVNLTLKFNKNLGANDSWMIVYNLPDIKTDFIITDIEGKHLFRGVSSNDSLSFYYDSNSITSGTTLKFQFKYMTN